ncbi:MAG: hypothetical protein U0S12_04035 [Fimbriimonadales bacterium]
MRLKVATTISFLVGMAMLVAWPWLVGSKPEGDRKAVLQYLLRASEYFIALLVVFFVTATLAWLTARRQREEYQEQSLENLKELIEGTLEDHGKKPR